MYLKLIPYVLVASILSFGVYKWMDMKNTIVTQTNQISNLKAVEQILISNIETNERIAKDSKKKAIFEAISTTKKTHLEKGMKYDKSSSIDINSTRFYL